MATKVVKGKIIKTEPAKFVAADVPADYPVATAADIAIPLEVSTKIVGTFQGRKPMLLKGRK